MLHDEPEERKARNARGPCARYHIVLLTERVTQRAQISPVIMRLCLLANTKSWKLMLVNFESSQLLHLGIKFTFFVVLDTSQSIKRKHFWGRYGGGVIGSWCKPIKSEVSNSERSTAVT